MNDECSNIKDAWHTKTKISWHRYLPHQRHKSCWRYHRTPPCWHIVGRECWGTHLLGLMKQRLLQRAPAKRNSQLPFSLPSPRLPFKMQTFHPLWWTVQNHLHTIERRMYIRYSKETPYSWKGSQNSQCFYYYSHFPIINRAVSSRTVSNLRLKQKHADKEHSVQQVTKCWNVSFVSGVKPRDPRCICSLQINIILA